MNKVGRVSKWYFKESSVQKSLMFIIEFLADGQTYKWTGFPESQSEIARDIFAKSIRAVGFQGEDLSILASDENALSTEIDVELIIESEEYNGNTYDKVKYINPIGSAMDSKSITNRLSKVNLQSELSNYEEVKEEVVKETTFKPFSQNDGHDLPF